MATGPYKPQRRFGVLSAERGISSPPVYRNMIAYDLFDGINGTNLNSHTPIKGGAWTQPFSGTDQLKLNGSGAAYPLYPSTTWPRHILDSAASANGTFDLVYYQNATLNDVGFYGVIFNYQDTSNYWVAGGYFNFMNIRKVIAGVITDVVAGAWTSGGSGNNAQHTIRVIVNGDNIKLYRDGTLQSNYTAVGRQLKTASGIGVHSAFNGFGGVGYYSELRMYSAYSAIL